MTLHQAAKYVADRFVYKEGKELPIDQWFVMKEDDGKMHGDCDDYTITVLWPLNEKSLRKFIWNVLITRKHEIHRVKTNKGEYHIVGCVDGLWFDNWVGLPEPEYAFFAYTQHRRLHKYNAFTIIPKLVMGLFYRNK